MNEATPFQNQVRRAAAMPRVFIALLMICMGFRAAADETIPPAPNHYFNDYANVVSAAVAKRIDLQLQQFEKDTTGQIVVAIFPKMQSDSSLADYSLRIARAWRIGQKDKNNEMLLVVFIKDRKMQIETGLGYESIVTDAICQNILDEEIIPRFRKGDFDGGLTAAVNAMISATRGEYKGKGAETKTAAPQ
jgi:uncharacterized protein